MGVKTVITIVSQHKDISFRHKLQKRKPNEAQPISKVYIFDT